MGRSKLMKWTGQAGKFFFRMKGYYPVRIGKERFRGTPEHAFFWRIVNQGGFEPGFFQILNRFLTRDVVYCDIGAWIGPTAMYASRICNRVIALEPDPVAWNYLLKNISLNKIANIAAFHLAIGAENGVVKMASHGQKPGDSMSSMVNIEQKQHFFETGSITWKTFTEREAPGKIDFIKMDIEGGEVVVIPTMAEYLKIDRPLLHLSMHPAYLPRHHREALIGNIFNLLSFNNEVRDEQMKIVNVEELEKIQQSPDFRSFLFIS